jgi:hypothetical protein
MTGKANNRLIPRKLVNASFNVGKPSLLRLIRRVGSNPARATVERHRTHLAAPSFFRPTNQGVSSFSGQFTNYGLPIRILRYRRIQDGRRKKNRLMNDRLVATTRYNISTSQINGGRFNIRAIDPHPSRSRIKSVALPPRRIEPSRSITWTASRHAR